MKLDLKTILAIISALGALFAGINWNFEIEKGKGFKNENIAYKIQVGTLSKRTECK